MSAIDRKLTWTQEPPTEAGWYFYCTNKNDFDIAKPIAVQRIEEGSGRCWCRVMREDGNVNDIRSQKFAGYWWYGPIRVPTTLGEGA